MFLKILLLSLVVSCGSVSTKLSKKGKEVQILNRYSKKDCESVDRVIGVSKKGLESLAKNQARNLAAKAGGNAITFDEVVQNAGTVKVHSTAYLCP